MFGQGFLGCGEVCLQLGDLALQLIGPGCSSRSLDLHALQDAVHVSLGLGLQACHGLVHLLQLRLKL